MGKNHFLKDFSALPEDVLIENERGVTLLGYPLFSPKILLPHVDPPQFQRLNTENGSLIALSKNTISNFIELYPIDLSTERTAGSSSSQMTKWFVLMDYKEKYDIDDQGWCYSWNFNNSRWKSKNGLVRRRVWVRLPTTSHGLD
ncbi:HN1_G0001190.mRNA.1.CDS.1 [Saccharomyces cerevisiae]|nr:HN1_G0001190.mRNA.1.CDS.1 [Saccharomyces cerevisiae]CAI4401752.1 BAL_1a_G0014690.mRNA.1.CDS.1 [Saccharomyces cerevisiae]CAI7100720.1 BAL_1a_G0014690.mRNA.1.CDS.1 [Saccharomyces cerevisiae]